MKNIFDQMAINLGYRPVCQHKTSENGGYSFRECERKAEFLVKADHCEDRYLCRYHLRGVYRNKTAVVTRIKITPKTGV